jgi:hypothetical protein
LGIVFDGARRAQRFTFQTQKMRDSLPFDQLREYGFAGFGPSFASAETPNPTLSRRFGPILTESAHGGRVLPIQW